MLLGFEGVWKSYPHATGQLHALRDVSVRIEQPRSIAIVGRSGSGKSTFLHLAAGIDQPTEGRVELLGGDLTAMSDRERTRQRRDAVGLVFQFFHLLPHLDVRHNVLLPALIAGGRRRDADSRAAALLDEVGLLDRAADRVDKLSGGEMQRVAICRALLRDPRVILADEPTGNLDDENGRRVMQLLLNMARDRQALLIFVTHSREMAALADETWTMHSGRLEA